MSEYDLSPLIERLTALSEKGYAAFNQSLSPTAQGVFLGVRMPKLRAISKEIAKSEDWRGFLDASRDHGIFEVKMLHGMVLGLSRCDIDEKLALTEAYLPHIDDWGLCDCLCTSFKPRESEKDAVFKYALACADSDAEFRKRFGLVMLMSYFHDVPWIDGTIAAYRRFHHEGYYARMGAAWGLATLWLYAREACLSILEENLWDVFTHNKAIQKLCESYRITEDDKALAKSLRRKREKKK